MSVAHTSGLVVVDDNMFELKIVIAFVPAQR